MSTKLDDFYELKPCPFCGGEELAVYLDPQFDTFCVTCPCGGVGPADLGESGAVDRWNERVTA